VSTALVPERATSEANDEANDASQPLNEFVHRDETGQAGLTLTYIYDVNRNLIIVSQGAEKLGNHRQDLKAQYGVPANYTVWDSKNGSGSLQILVINIDSFASDSNIINTVREQGVKPIEFLQATRPIVIVDEPQNMETELRRQAIHNLNPFCTLRYSATHKNPYNLISRLTPVDAYNLGLVKQIQVDGITADKTQRSFCGVEGTNEPRRPSK
jgi:hypothetical protein